MPKMLTKKCAECKKAIRYTKAEWDMVVAVWKAPSMFGAARTRHPRITCDNCYLEFRTNGCWNRFYADGPSALLVPGLANGEEEQHG